MAAACIDISQERCGCLSQFALKLPNTFTLKKTEQI
jgi:hypothetical protein